jgi:hypothetical protein
MKMHFYPPRMKFHIIYTPGSVKHLQLFLFSLLKWLDCSFCLVANGCSAEETRILQTLCQDNPRLEFLELSRKNVLEHGQALSILHTREHSEHFCFMDSDILAIGDFLSELEPYLGQNAGVFSGSPLFCSEAERTLPENFSNLGGRFNRTERGLCLGSSYLAMYNNSVLTQVMQSTSIGFELAGWTDVPEPYQKWLVEMEVQSALYDTGKLLNLVLLAQGERLIFVDSPNMRHISGMSDSALRESGLQPQRTTRQSATQWARRKLGQLMISAGLRTDTEITMQLKIGRKRRTVSRHITEVLRALFENRPLPLVPDMDDRQIAEEIRRTTADIVALYEEFEMQLVR